MPHVLLSPLLAFAGYSLLNIAQACQKIGLGLLPGNRLKGGIIWIIATVVTSVSVFVVHYAVAIGSVSVVGAMAGTGLASLAIFSRLVMKEKMGKRELTGVFIILGAAALIGGFSGETETEGILLSQLYIFTAFIVLSYIVLWLLLHGYRNTIGLIIGGFAGAMGGFVPLYQKVSISSIGRAASFLRLEDQAGRGPIARVEVLLANPYAVTWIALSIASMAVLQFAYGRDKAIRIIPVFSANYILIPVLGGVFCFRESLAWLQWLGIALILTGVWFLTFAPRKAGMSAREAGVSDSEPGS
ncbi:MAG TPA: hypothetical protein VMX75_03305 [Spirochaetia bacterium]|nr:hypothetical protein [Spirochaetia bacterium]